MLTHKVVERTARGKVEAEYDHCVALDWSLTIMAIAHMARRDQAPRVFERPASLKKLKTYLGSLKGRVILTFEESGFAHWLYLELLSPASVPLEQSRSWRVASIQDDFLVPENISVIEHAPRAKQDDPGIRSGLHESHPAPPERHGARNTVKV